MPTAVYAIVFDDALDDATLEEIKGAYGDGVYEHSDHLLFISTDDLAGTVKNKTKIGGEEGAHSGIIIQMTKKYMGYTRVTAWEWLAARLGDE